MATISPLQLPSSRTSLLHSLKLRNIANSSHRLRAPEECSLRRNGPPAPAKNHFVPFSCLAKSKSRQDFETETDPSSGKVTGGSSQADYSRLFSSLDQTTLRHEPGSLLSSILLVAGTTVGAGILAIPAVTQDAGFLASIPTCIACWLYMVTTGLLLAEVNISTMCELGSGGVSLVSMADRTLGRFGVIIACGTYVFIHYALLVAYVARSADIIAAVSGGEVPTWAGGLTFTALLGGLCYFGSQKVIGAVNGGLVAAILASFALLVVQAGGQADPAELLRANWTAVPASVPIIALSFVYQNVVPIVATNLEGNPPRIRTAVVVGTAIPLLMFVAWDAVILASNHALPPGVDPLMQLRGSSSLVGPAVDLFSFLAVATSYIGFVLGLSDFLADWLRLPSGDGSHQPWPYALTLFPPLAMAVLYPDVFFRALDVAGTYGVSVLFGIIPAAMVWSERYSTTCLKPCVEPMVPGGKITLVAVMAAAGAVICGELSSTVLGLM